MPSPSRFDRFTRFLRELKRRKVYRVGAVYVVVGLAVAQGGDWLFQIIGLPDVTGRIVAIVVLLGLPVALVLAWAHELRPDDLDSGTGPTTPGPSDRVAPTGDTASADRHASIVVLPFDNFSPDPADAYFADGLTEEITSSLSRVGELRVTSRNSATVLKKAGKSTAAIGSELGVAFVLEGSVRKAGDALRVTAQLIRADTDEHLWSERYDGALRDVFGMQEEVARSIVRTLRLQLRPEEDRRLAERPMDDVRAYECYLKARETSLRWTIEAQEHALRLLEEARAKTGPNAVIEAGIGYVYGQFANIGAQDRDYVMLGREHGDRALDLDPENPDAHMVQGFLHMIGPPDLDRAAHHLERSLEIKPDDSHALFWYVQALAMLGRNPEMKRAADRLSEVDPLNPLSHAMQGYALQAQGDLEGSLRETELWAAASPPGTLASFFLAHDLVLVGRRDEALAILRQEYGADSDPGPFIGPLVKLLGAALEEDPDAMDSVLTDEMRARIAQDISWSFYTTAIFALAGRVDETRELLRFIVDQGFANYPWIARHHPWLSRYRRHPTLEPIFDEVQAAWERATGSEASDSID